MSLIRNLSSKERWNITWALLQRLLLCRLTGLWRESARVVSLMAPSALWRSRLHWARLLCSTTLSFFALTGQRVNASLYLAAAPLMSPAENLEFPSSFTTKAAACFICRSSFGTVLSHLVFFLKAANSSSNCLVLVERCAVTAGEGCGM